tara:strand:- start:1203 stop:1697 length:495 start_codon:yes stop_codon:yes gene_type:complete
MKKETVNDKLSEALDIEYNPAPEEPKEIAKKEVAEVVSKEKLDKDLTQDYNRVRRNLKELINTGQNAIDGIINVASDSDSPRAYEVAGQMIKTVAEMNKDLMDLHGKMKTITKEDIIVNNNTTNSIYVGSTSDLQDLINQSRSAKKALETYDDVLDAEVVDSDD